MKINIPEMSTDLPQVGDIIEVRGIGFRMIVKDIHSDYYGLIMIGSNDLFCHGDMTLKGYRNISALLDGIDVVRVLDHKYLTLTQI